MSFLRLIISLAIIAIWGGEAYLITTFTCGTCTPQGIDWFLGILTGAFATAVTLTCLCAIYHFAGEVVKELS